MNYDNIKDKGFDKRSAEELREIAAKGGRNSGVTRRRKADFRKTLNMLLTSKVEDEDWKEKLEAVGSDCTFECAMLMSQILEALNGNTSAAQFVAQYAGQINKTELDQREQLSRIELNEAKKAVLTGENETNEALQKLDGILKGVYDNAVKQEAE
jgi:hypothetical protein